MDRSDVIYLINVTTAQDDYGVWVQSYSRKQVFCKVNSVTRAEFFDGGRNGLNPEFVFHVFMGDYSGEQIVEYNGQSYGVYRVYYSRNDTVELYAQRKGGTNYAPEPEEPSGDENGEEEDQTD